MAAGGLVGLLTGKPRAATYEARSRTSLPDESRLPKNTAIDSGVTNVVFTVETEIRTLFPEEIDPGVTNITCLPENKAIAPGETNVLTGFLSVTVIEDEDASVDEDPELIVFLEFSGRREGFGLGTEEEWRSFFTCDVISPPVNFHGITSTTDFAGPGDPNIYDIRTVTATVDDGGNPTYVIRLADENFSPALAVSQNGNHQIILKRDDVVPRASTPPLTGNTITELGVDGVISKTHVAVAGYGNGFSGVYAWKLPGPGSIIPVVENFSNAGNEFGTISFVDFADDDTLLFTSEKGLYRVDLTGPGQAAIIVASGAEYAAGKQFRNPSWFEVAGDRAVVQASDGTFRPAVFEVNLADGKLKYVAGADTPIPGETGNFSNAQRPIASEGVIVFEAFKGFQYDGAYAYVDGQVIPIAKRGQTLDGKVVRLAPFERGSVSGNLLGLAVYFEDNSSAPYLVTVESKPEVAQFVAGSASFSSSDGFSVKFKGTVGTSYDFEYRNPSAALDDETTWIKFATATYDGTELTVRDQEAFREAARLYRARAK